LKDRIKFAGQSRIFLQFLIMKNQGYHLSGSNQASLRFYSSLGLPVLNRLIMSTIGKFVLLVNPREKMPFYFIGHPFSVKSLALTIKWLYFNEIVHLGLIVVCAALGQFFWTKGYYDGVMIMALSILLNIGLALMQRMNRIRIKRTMAFLKKREPSDPGL